MSPTLLPKNALVIATMDDEQRKIANGSAFKENQRKPGQIYFSSVPVSPPREDQKIDLSRFLTARLSCLWTSFIATGAC